MIRRLTILTACLLIAGPALAGQPVELKAGAAASGPITLGDLFDGAGPAAAKVVVGPAAPIGGNMVLDAAQVQRAARMAGLDWDNPSGLRRISVRGGPAATATPNTPAASARQGAMVEVLTYVRNLNAGDVVEADDLTWGEVAAFSAPKDAPKDAEDIIGKQAKKPVRAGAAVSGRDLAMPQVIKKDDMVQVIYAADGVRLVLQGKALETAALGDAFSVLNTTSKKTIEAVATGPGRAVIGPEAERLRAAAIPSTLAVR